MGDLALTLKCGGVAGDARVGVLGWHYGKIQGEVVSETVFRSKWRHDHISKLPLL